MRAIATLAAWSPVTFFRGRRDLSRGDRIGGPPGLADEAGQEDGDDPTGVQQKPWDAPKPAGRQARTDGRAWTGRHARGMAA